MKAQIRFVSSLTLVVDELLTCGTMGRPVKKFGPPSMISRNFDWINGNVVFWDLDSVDESRPLVDQAEQLKEDLAQIEYPAGIVLDVGWYPEFAPTGNFAVCVVQEGEWQRPLFQKRGSRLEELKASIAEAIRVAAEASARASSL